MSGENGPTVDWEKLDSMAKEREERILEELARFYERAGIELGRLGTTGIPSALAAQQVLMGSRSDSERCPEPEEGFRYPDDPARDSKSSA